MVNTMDVAVEVNVAHVVEQMMQALNAHDVEKLAALVTADYEGIDVNQRLPQRGRGEAMMVLELYIQAFPDLRMVEHEAVIEGDRAAIMWTARGTHLGTIMHIPPSGKPVEVRGTTVLHLNGSCISRAVTVWDVAAMLREIGLLPEL
jgi:steroid delta-isomerase-like uncharacterized protein